MLELMKQLIMLIIMVPIAMAIILSLIWWLGKVFNLISKIGHHEK